MTNDCFSSSATSVRLILRSFVLHIHTRSHAQLMMLSYVSFAALVIPAIYNLSQIYNDADGSAISRVSTALTGAGNHEVLSGLEQNFKHRFLIVSRGTAIVLLFVYVAYLFFQVTIRLCPCIFVPNQRQER